MIDNLPFNTLDYNDGLVVLENNFKSNLLLSKADMLNYITISYKIVNKEISYRHDYAKLNLYLIGLSIFIIIIAFYSYTIFNGSTNIVYIPLDNVDYMPLECSKDKPNKCVFGLFNEVFKTNNSSYIHYPSHFVTCISKYNKHEVLPLLDYIRHEQYLMLLELVELVFDNLGTSSNLAN